MGKCIVQYSWTTEISNGPGSTLHLYCSPIPAGLLTVALPLFTALVNSFPVTVSIFMHWKLWRRWNCSSVQVSTIYGVAPEECKGKAARCCFVRGLPTVDGKWEMLMVLDINFKDHNTVIPQTSVCSEMNNVNDKQGLYSVLSLIALISKQRNTSLLV